jgi:type I restriction enzyme, S subunit
MTPELLLAHYDRIADAPDAVARLRQLIRNLAVRGKLVPQEPHERPSPKMIHARFAGTAVLPQSWLWARLGDLLLGDTRNGYSRRPDDAENGTPILRISAGTTLGDAVVAEEEHKLISGIDEAARLQYGLRRGDLLACRFNGNKAFAGRITLFTDYLGINPIYPDKLIRLTVEPEFAIPEFICLAAETDWVRDSVEAFCNTTVGNWGISASNLKEVPFPIPPLAEQHRIVAKVDELMGLCDRLEAARAGREATRDRLAAASLARLNAPDPDPAIFADHARFALNTLPAVTNRRDQIKQLRQTILNLAVRGKLLAQHAQDEPAPRLLASIRSEKAKLAKAGVISRQASPCRDQTYLAHAAPAGWAVIALGEICAMVTSGSRGWGEFYAETGPNFIRAQNIRFGRLELGNLAHVDPPAKSEGSRTVVAPGDVFVVITGAGVTTPAILERDIGETYVSQHVALIKLVDKRLSKWLLLCLMAVEGGRGELVARAYGSGKPGLNLDHIRTLSIPVPPLAEQHRIVAKVDELMALCDRLEESLATTDTARSRLLDALLAEALEPAIAAEREAA